MISVSFFSEPGGHPVTEDAFAVRLHPSDPDCWLCFLADGQGGRSGGAKAASIACSMAMETASSHAPRILTQPSSWADILQEADRAALHDPDAGFTTLLGFCITGESLVGASSGDSAVLSLSGGESAVDLTRGQFKNPPVGSGAASFVPFSARLVRSWSVLAMSDGVWKFVGWERLIRAAESLRGKALLETLQAFARLPRSGQFPDDFTLIAFDDAA